MIEISLNAPSVEGNRVRFSWTPSTGLFKRDSYTVGYPDLAGIDASPGKLAEAYFPLCLAFSCLAGFRVKLPARIDEAVFRNWQDLFAVAGRGLGAAPSSVIENGDAPPLYREGPRDKTVLFFGGGAESLVTLARLMERGVAPMLASFGGPNWPGSNPEDNFDKFLMDLKVSEHFGLQLLRVRTDFKDIFDVKAWEARLKPGVSLINAVVALPSFLSFLFPVAEQTGAGRLVNGNEKMNFPDEYYCFSPEITDRMASVSKGLAYESWLGELLKEDVCKELYEARRPYAKFQYSCWRNHGRRWCYACQSCLEYFMLLKNSGLDPSFVGMDESAVRLGLRKMIRVTAHSDEGRPGEIWGRMVSYPRLRRDPFLRGVLDEIRVRAFVHHRIARAAAERFLPRPVRAGATAGKRRLRRTLAQAAKAALKGLYEKTPLGPVVRAARWRFAFDVWVAEGTVRGGDEPLAIAYAGTEPYRNGLFRLAFEGTPSIRAYGRFWPWDVERAVRAVAPAVDAVYYEVTPFRAPFFRASSHFRAPLWMRTDLDVSDLEGLMKKSMRYKNVMRHIRKSDFRADHASDTAALDEFYHDMYLPYIGSRHGGAALFHDYATMKRRFAKGCEIVFVRAGKDGKRLGGAMVDFSVPRPQGLYLGVRGADPALLTLGVPDAIYYFELARIRERGFKTANLGHSRGFLNDGPLGYKLSFGARLERSHLEAEGELHVRFVKPTRALRRFLAANPFVVREGRRYFAAAFEFPEDGFFSALPAFARGRAVLDGTFHYTLSGGAPVLVPSRPAAAPVGRTETEIFYAT